MELIWIQKHLFRVTRKREKGKRAIYKYDSQYKACGIYKVTVLWREGGQFISSFIDVAPLLHKQ